MGLWSSVYLCVRYSQVCQGLESSEGKLGQCPDVIVFNEAGENKNVPQLPLRTPDTHAAISPHLSPDPSPGV
jgi:hypothetical protein